MATKKKEELYVVAFLTPNMRVSAVYRVGERYTLGIAPSKVIHISLLQGKIGVYFEDGTRMVRGYEPLTTELYYKPIKEEDNGAA